MWRLASVALLWASTTPSAAAPACLPLGTPELHVHEARTFACASDDTSESCVLVSPRGVVEAERPSVGGLVGTLLVIHQDTHGAWQFCPPHAATCRPLASSIVGALEAAKTREGAYPRIEVSPDGRVVVLGTRRAFVDTREVVLVPPREYRALGKEPPSLVELQLVGNALVAEWANCAGPCATAVVVDRKGRNGPWFPAGIEVPMTAKQFLVLPTSDASTVSLVDGATGRIVARTRVTSRGALVSMAAIHDGKRAVALWDDYGHWKLGTFAIVRGQITKRILSIDRCP